MTIYLAIAIVVAVVLLWDWISDGREYVDCDVILAAVIVGLLWPLSIAPIAYYFCRVR